MLNDGKNSVVPRAMKTFCMILNQFVSGCVSSSCQRCIGEVPDPEEETPPLPFDGKRRVRKRCQCGRFFLINSNRQRACERCGEMGGKRRKAEWARKNRKEKSVSRRLERNFRNEIMAF